ncbi:hypothetical protein [Dyella silvae]|uniref:hypothetical protein n=1 Tax=Dyella silvae TaxID=2994424 RepID=UPI0022651685|nr:hypothetical protein [Dyella silvae]
MVARKTRGTVTIKVSHEYRVSLPRVALSKSLQFIDVDNLEKRKKATIDFGHVETECCSALIRVDLEYGKIKAFRTERCKTAGTPSKAFITAVSAARKKLKQTKGAGIVTVGTPISEVLSSALRLPDIIISDGCIMVCWDGSDGREHCFFCCLDPRTLFFCMGPSDLQAAL